VRILWDVETEKVSASLFRDRFGCEWKREHGGSVFVNPPLTGPDAAKIPRIELITDADVQLIRETRRLQPEAMDIRQVKREFGKDLTFRGGIGTQRIIVFGTPAQARAEVLDAVRVLSEDGGYFLETAKPLPEETPVANAVAVIEAMGDAMNARLA
jgi:hypothetical protein